MSIKQTTSKVMASKPMRRQAALTEEERHEADLKELCRNNPDELVDKVMTTLSKDELAELIAFSSFGYFNGYDMCCNEMAQDLGVDYALVDASDSPFDNDDYRNYFAKADTGLDDSAVDEMVEKLNESYVGIPIFFKPSTDEIIVICEEFEDKEFDKYFNDFCDQLENALEAAPNTTIREWLEEVVSLNNNGLAYTLTKYGL